MTPPPAISEHEWLAKLPRILGIDSTHSTLVGIGDDAAVLAGCSQAQLLTVDSAVEGVHFTRDLLSLEDLGYRSLMAAVSDIAAMGGSPQAIVSAIVFPPSLSSDELDRLVQGQAFAARELQTCIVGGNLSSGPCLTITTTVLGHVKDQPLQRSGVQSGDHLYLWGSPGQAAAGLHALQTNCNGASAAIDHCIHAWRRPQAWIRQGLEVASLASAAIDVSDGLAQDAGHLARASHVRLVLDDARVQVAAGSEFQQSALDLGLCASSLALTGGEDYALLVASPHDLSQSGWVYVGWAEAGEANVVVLRDGSYHPSPTGFDHGTGS